MFARLFPYFAIVFVCLGVFGRALGGEFITWDDAQHFALNPHLVAGDVRFFWTNFYYGMFVPVIYTVWTVLYSLSQAPWIFHALNLLLHTANAVMVYVLIRRLLNVEIRAALVAALFFAVFPLQVESVAWISEGRGQLAAFFAFGAVLLLIASPRRGRDVLSTFMFALAMLAKPSVAPLPLALFLLDTFLRKRAFNPRLLGVWASLSVGTLLLTFQAQSPAAEPRLDFSWTERLLVAVDTLGFYARSFAVPWPLSFSYDRQIEKILAEQLYLGSAASLALAIGLIFALRRSFGPLVYGAALFIFVFLLPVSGIVPFAGQVQSTVFDRHMYMPMFGLCLILALIAQSKRLRGFLCVLLGACMVLSFLRAGDWQSNRSLFESALAIHPLNYMALNNLAVEEIAQKNYAQAERLLRSAVESRPKEALAASNWAHAMWMLNDVGGILQNIKPLTETRVFLDYNAREFEALSLIHRMVARALSATLDREGARQAYEAAIRYRPDDEGLRKEFGYFMSENGR